jgi:hypothetical protein
MLSKRDLPADSPVEPLELPYATSKKLSEARNSGPLAASLDQPFLDAVAEDIAKAANERFVVDDSLGRITPLPEPTAP